MAIHIGARLVGGAALHGLCGLAELQIDAGAEATAFIELGALSTTSAVCWMLNMFARVS